MFIFKICIKVRDKQFRHQMLYTGDGQKMRCHFCQLECDSLKEYWEAAEQYYLDYQI